MPTLRMHAMTDYARMSGQTDSAVNGRSLSLACRQPYAGAYADRNTRNHRYSDGYPVSGITPEHSKNRETFCSFTQEERLSSCNQQDQLVKEHNWGPRGGSSFV